MKRSPLRAILIAVLAVLVVGNGVIWVKVYMAHRSKPATSQQTTTKAAERTTPKTDRGISYDAMYFPADVSEDKIRSELNFIKAQNVTSLYVTCNEADIENPAKLQKISKVGRELGFRLYVNPYIGGTFSGDEGNSSQYYLAQHPESMQVSRRGLKAERFPSINDPGYREYLKGRIAQLAKMDFDGIQFDEPQAGDRGAMVYASQPGVDYFPYDKFSQELFKKQYGYDPPAFETEDSLAFRRASVLSFTKELVDYTREIKADWTTILVLQPDFNDRDVAGTNNWADYAKLEKLDVFMIDPYWYPEVDRGWEWFIGNLMAFRHATKGTHQQTGIWARGFGLTEGYDQITQSVKEAQKYTGWQAVWVTDNWQSKDPAAAWAAIKAGFAQ